jgi:hemerythrin-like metal-binding protein
MPLSSRSKHKPRIVWRESYSVGIEDLDSQHRKLLELINEIGDAAGTGLSKASCFAVLNAMIRYAQEHFTTEERYLEKHAYPKYLDQKGAHEKFVQETFTMAQELDEEGLLTLGGITIYLEDWYQDHILGFDQDYRAFFEKQPVKSDDLSAASPVETNA